GSEAYINPAGRGVKREVGLVLAVKAAMQLADSSNRPRRKRPREGRTGRVFKQGCKPWKQEDP
ncbi:MAG: hypothetical protein EB107_12030, partial [Proteobacteria bacterium]|nr:hypothetical protein [Pseudomonadota bacterium]